MSDTVLPFKKARAGSKKGWRVRATQLPPDLDASLEARCLAEGKRPTEVIYEAVVEHLGPKAKAA